MIPHLILKVFRQYFLSLRFTRERDENVGEVVGLTAPVAHRCSPGSSGSASLTVAVVVSDGLRENGNFRLVPEIL